ncbi:MAG: helix-turn-helix domain-containing protein [Pseudomonadota bacterium]
MSHKATMWLAGIEPARMTPGAFRVMFHLCDCHNPSQGCFPSQKYLREMTGLSHSGLNKILGQLEADGLISRHQQVDQQTRKQRPTRYMLAFEDGFKSTAKTASNDPEETPQNGGKNRGEPGPLSGHGPESTFGPIPSPLGEQSRVHRGGHKPVKEPVREPRARNRRPSTAPDPLIGWAQKVRRGSGWVKAHITADMARQMLGRKLVQEDQLRALGIAW